MNITKTAAKAFLLANWQLILICLAGLLLIIFVGSQIQSCREDGSRRKTEKQKAEINEGKGAAKEIEEERTDEQKDIKAADDAANSAAVNFNAVQHTDSSSRSNKWTDAKREYCQDRPADSKCRPE